MLYHVLYHLSNTIDTSPLPPSYIDYIFAPSPYLIQYSLGKLDSETHFRVLCDSLFGI